VITPRSTRLIRAADLQAFQRAIVSRIPVDTVDARACAVIVPTRSAAEELRRTFENMTLLGAEHPSCVVRVLPDLLTRDEFYLELHGRLPAAPALLTPFEREVLLRRAAEGARTSGAEPPFNLRAGLIAEMLALYDELRRRHKTVADFDRLLTGELQSSAEYDRGAARLLQQTRFLVATFEAFERLTVDKIDEHGIRVRALAADVPLYSRVIVTVADQPADARGLWTADFDLLARLPRLDAIDVVATEALLDAGFYTRLHEHLLPGIEDIRHEQAAAPLPTLVVPDMPRSDDAERVFRCRDREEELADFARMRKSAAQATPLSRTAIVFRRPLPYLYLARQVFDAAGLPWQALDSLPLAAEPFAAAIDVLFSAVAAGFTRGALLDILRSPHFSFSGPERELAAHEVHQLDRWLVEKKFLGSVERLTALADGAPAYVRVAADVATELSAAMDALTAPEQIAAFRAFVAAHERLPRPDMPSYARHLRARSAVLDALDALAAAHAAHDAGRLTIAELSGSVRRWIENQTFAPRYGTSGIRLLDARAAAYADLDELRIVGLTESDWPERSTRSIFYPQSLLSALGWPADQDRLAASRTQFQDLLMLPRRRVSLSTFTLEDDALVTPSTLIDEIDAVGLPVERLREQPLTRVFSHEALTLDPPVPPAIDGPASVWFALRAARACEGAEFRGQIGSREPVAYAVSRLERYLECPFKYFAANVLHLQEERDEEAWLTPQERGQFVHAVFEQFFDEWQRRGMGAITPANASDALETFERVAEEHLARLPEGDRALERALLLGSAAAPGLGERAFAFEIDDQAAVVERLLEYELSDTFTFESENGMRRVRLRSKADRIDLLDDGTLRILDYKLGRAPDRKRSLQLPIYGVCAQQALDGRRGRSWSVSRAGYIAFKERSAFVELQNVESALADGQARMLSVIDRIEAGDFPVEPDEPFLCNRCAFPGVCRKDYVGDE
jgi:RecB family exonuclease